MGAGVISDSEKALQIAEKAGCSSCRSLREVFNAQLDQQPSLLPPPRQFAMACMHDLGAGKIPSC